MRRTLAVAVVLLLAGCAAGASAAPDCDRSPNAKQCRTPTVTSIPSPTATSSPTATESPVPTTITRSPSPAPILVKLGQDMPTVAQFGANAALYDSRPFDGWVITHTYASSWWDGTAITQAQWATAISAMPSGLVNAQHNFLRLLNSESAYIDFYDDTLWATTASNIENMAAAMLASGKQFDGIFFDIEAYGTVQPFLFGDVYPNQATAWSPSPSTVASGVPSGTTAASAIAKVMQRGKQVMDAARAAWPGIKWWTTYGPPSSESITWSHADGQNWGNDTAPWNELMGCFTYGIAQSTFGTSAKYLDGAEATYEIRTQARADRARNWFKHLWASNSTHIVPTGEASSYVASVVYAPAMYDRDALNAYVNHTASNLQTYLTYSMNSADTYSWLYTEIHEWGASGSGKPAVTQPYIDAVINARAAAT